MTLYGILQILLFFILILLITKPMGIYLKMVYNGERTLLDRFVGPIERFV